MRALAERCDRTGYIPLHAGPLVEPHDVRCLQSMRQCVAMRAQLHGVRSRFQYCDDSLAPDFPAQSIDGCFHGRRMMRKVIVYRDPIHLAPHFHPSPHTLELFECGGRSLDVNSSVSCCEHRGEGVLRVMPTEQTPLHVHDLAIPFDDGELTEVAPRLSRNVPGSVAVHRTRESLDRCPTSHVDDVHDIGIACVCDE